MATAERIAIRTAEAEERQAAALEALLERMVSLEAKFDAHDAKTATSISVLSRDLNKKPATPGR